MIGPLNRWPYAIVAGPPTASHSESSADKSLTKLLRPTSTASYFRERPETPICTSKTFNGGVAGSLRLPGVCVPLLCQCQGFNVRLDQSVPFFGRMTQHRFFLRHCESAL